MRLSIVSVMKPMVVTGILLAALGSFIVFKGISFHSTGTYRMGPFHGGVQAESWIPAWVGGVAIVGGLLLVVASSRRKG